MVQVVIAVVLLAVAIGIAYWLEHRPKPELPLSPVAPIPQQLHRADFPRPDAPWLVVLFSSGTCESCGPMAEKVKALESDEVAVAEIEYSSERELHARYGIEAVPIVVVVDAEGVTHKSFVGNASATDLWAAVAELRA